MSRPRARLASTAVVIIVFVLMASGCGRDATVAAATVNRGTSLRELEQRAGQPSVRRNVDLSDKTDLCSGDPLNVKAVVYEAYVGPAKALRLLGSPPSFVVEVCLDRADTVTAVHSYHNN